MAKSQAPDPALEAAEKAVRALEKHCASVARLGKAITELKSGK